MIVRFRKCRFFLLEVYDNIMLNYEYTLGGISTYIWRVKLININLSLY